MHKQFFAKATRGQIHNGPTSAVTLTSYKELKFARRASLLKTVFTTKVGVKFLLEVALKFSSDTP
jgi:hypothetical protein